MEHAPQKVVRLSAGDDTVPLWEVEALSWEDLPLPPRLQADLREWVDRYDAGLTSRWRWQARGGRRGWLADGQRLAARLQAELGADYTVAYDAR